MAPLRPTRPKAAEFRQPQSREPLLGVAAERFAADHGRQLDALGSELQEFERRRAEAEPRLTLELHEVRRLRRDLALNCRETDLCERALAQHKRERLRAEALAGELADRELLLESLEVRQAEECPSVQRLLRVSAESQEVARERDLLSLEVSKLGEANRSREQEVQALNAALRRQAASLGAVDPSLLYDLADFRDRFGTAELQMEATGAETTEFMRDEEAAERALNEARWQYLEDAGRLPRLDADMINQRAARAKSTSELVDACELQEVVIRRTIRLAEGRAEVQGELSAAASSLLRCEEARADLQLDLSTTARATEHSAAESAQALLAEASVRDELRRKLAYEAFNTDTASAAAAAAVADSAAVAAQAEALRQDLAASEASRLHLRHLIEGLDRQGEAELCACQRSREQVAVLLASRQDTETALRLGTELETLALGERQAARALQDRAQRIGVECNRASEDARLAIARCEETLAATASDDALLRAREMCHQAQLAAREEVQAALARDMEGASHSLRALQAARSELLVELEKTRRESRSIEAVLSAANLSG